MRRKSKISLYSKSSRKLFKTVIFCSIKINRKLPFTFCLRIYNVLLLRETKYRILIRSSLHNCCIAHHLFWRYIHSKFRVFGARICIVKKRGRHLSRCWFSMLVKMQTSIQWSWTNYCHAISEVMEEFYDLLPYFMHGQIWLSNVY